MTVSWNCDREMPHGDNLRKSLNLHLLKSPTAIEEGEGINEIFLTHHPPREDCGKSEIAGGIEKALQIVMRVHSQPIKGTVGP